MWASLVSEVSEATEDLSWLQLSILEQAAGEEKEEVTIPFWNHVEKTGECWNWTGYIRSKGYGWARVNGRSAHAHRHSYELTYGAIPDGLQLHHVCGNKSCVRPDHLQTMTPTEHSRHSNLGIPKNYTPEYRNVLRDRIRGKWKLRNLTPERRSEIARIARASPGSGRNSGRKKGSRNKPKQG